MVLILKSTVYKLLVSENKLILCRYLLQTVIWWWILFKEKLLLFFPNITILKKNCYYLFISTFYDSNSVVIGILVSENMKNDSSIMLNF